MTHVRGFRWLALHVAGLIAVLCLSSTARADGTTPAGDGTLVASSDFLGSQVIWFQQPLSGGFGWTGAVHAWAYIVTGPYAGMVLERVSDDRPAGIYNYDPARHSHDATWIGDGSSRPITNLVWADGYQLGDRNCQHLIYESTGWNPEIGGVNNLTYNPNPPPPGVLDRGPNTFASNALTALHTIVHVVRDGFYVVVGFFESTVGTLWNGIKHFFGVREVDNTGVTEVAAEQQQYGISMAPAGEGYAAPTSSYNPSADPVTTSYQTTVASQVGSDLCTQASIAASMGNQDAMAYLQYSCGWQQDAIAAAAGPYQSIAYQCEQSIQMYGAGATYANSPECRDVLYNSGSCSAAYSVVASVAGLVQNCRLMAANYAAYNPDAFQDIVNECIASNSGYSVEYLSMTMSYFESSCL